MLALRYVYILALAIWLGGMVVLGALVAPTTFEVLQTDVPDTGRTLAGDVFGTTIARFHYVAYACGGALVVTLTAMALLGPRPNGFAFRLILSGAMLLVALYSGFAIIGEMDDLQRRAGTPISRLPIGDIRRIRFDTLHQLSTRLMMVNVAGALILLYWDARDRL